MKYGALTDADVSTLESVLVMFPMRRCKLLEIGVHGGDTARGIKAYAKTCRTDLEYWGMDNGSHPDGQLGSPFEGAHFIQGDSAESFHLVPNDFNVVIVDGCHCINHVILDTLHYGKKVEDFGFMLFHDVGNHCQQTMKDPHGPNIPEFHNSVLAAHKLLEFPKYPWQKFISDGVDESKPFGGMSVYQKVP